MTGLTYSSDHYKHFQNNGDKNFFEEVIDLLMLDNIEGMTDSFKETIKNLPSKEKRMTILSLLDQDYNLFKQIKGLNDGNVSKMDHIKDVILMLREYVKVGEVEKKKYGEVMTPLDLVKEMLSTLPEEVWSNPNLKWLDPANGTGPFPCMVIYRLMKGLEQWQPDQEKRYRHIVENMIYVCELQPKNMFLYMCTVDPFDEYKLNVYTGSFLEPSFDKHMKDVWKLKNFDIIIGNPPYQEQVGEKNTEPIWDKFFDKSFSSLEENGLLNLVHPSSWRSPTGRFKYIQKQIYSNNLIFLCMNDFSDGLRVFGVGTNFDYYLLQKKPYNGSTITIDVDGNKEILDITTMEFIPNGRFQEFQNLCSKVGTEKIIILHSESSYAHRKPWMSKQKSEKNIYPCVYTITKKNGINFYYSQQNDKGHFGIPKVIWSNGLGTYPIIDENGEFGLMEYSFGIVDEIENLNYISEALMSVEFIEIMEYAKFTNNKFDHRVMKSLRKDFWKDFSTKFKNKKL